MRRDSIMRIRALACAITVLTWSLSSCQATTQLEGSDDMARAGSTGASPTQSSCDACYRSTCAWQVTECAGDPECARWLECARPCELGDDFNPSAACIGACALPDSHGGTQLRDALMSCIDRSGGCCGGADKVVDAGTGSLSDSDAAELDWGDGQTGPAPQQCTANSCKECMMAMVPATGAPSCLADGDSCGPQISACMSEAATANTTFGHGSCVEFVARFGACALDPELAQHTIESCVWAVGAESMERTLDALVCGASNCAACAPGAMAACLPCKVESCRFEMETLLGDVDAQGLFWCLRKCETGTDLAACRNACATEYQGGVPVLNALNQCVSVSCTDKC